MTTPSSTFLQGSRDNFDPGPLSWVISEIREALNRSRTALHEAAAQDADAQSTSMRHAKSYLHQAHGALQMVDIDGVAIITETVEDLFDRIDAGQLMLTPELAHTIGSGYQALIEYLEELLSGVSHQPVRLFPYYRTLLEARGAERIHPADLFFPNLAIRPQLPPTGEDVAPAVSYLSLRKRFEKALLPFLKNADAAAGLAEAETMRDIIGEVERSQSNQQTRAFWWVMHGLAEAVSNGEIQNEVYVKQLFARINLQIRRLSQGSPSIAERLLRDALFFIAKAKNPSPRAQQIRAVYRLDGLVPSDYDKEHYGQIDVDALAAAKERLSQAKNIWNKIVSGDVGVADSFEQEMRALVEAGAKLNSAPLTKLLRELKGIARHAAHLKPGDVLGLEMATSLLFVETALNNIGRLPDNFAERADAITARLLAVVAGEQPAASAQWLDDMSRQAQQRQTMVALANEMQASLRQVEKTLDEYFRDPAQHGQHASLSQLDSVLHQIEGALAILDQDDAVRVVQHTRAAVQHFLACDPEEDAPVPQECQQIAQNVGGLSFFIEMLRLNPDNAKDRFSFNEETGVFQANLVERNEAAEVPVEVDVPGGESVPDDALPSPAASGIQTVEDELAYHQQQSAELALSLTVDPDNQALQEQLKKSLQQIRLDATLIDNPEANDRAKAGIEILERPDFSGSMDALAGIITTTVPAQPESRTLPPVEAPETEEAIDAELLEIFLSEAEEVLGVIKETLPESRNAPHNQEHLTTLRRSFHTLKGSGRMVGLNAFGEAAWSIEQVLNLRLSEGGSGNPELYALLEKAAEILSAWVRDLTEYGKSDHTPNALIAAAERIKAGEDFVFEEEIPQNVQAGAGISLEQTVPLSIDADIEAGEQVSSPSSADVDDVVPELSDSPSVDVALELLAANNPVITPGIEEYVEPVEELLSALPQAEELQLSETDLAMFDAEEEKTPVEAEPVVDVVLPPVPTAEVIEFPTLQPPEPENGRNDNVKRIGDLEISVPLHNIYLAETDELVRLLAQDISEWRHEPDRQANIQSIHAAHSLSGSSATVGFTSLQEAAHALEMVLQLLVRRPVRLTVHELDTLEQSVERIKLMLQKFALGELPPYQPEYARLLSSIQLDIEARAEHWPDAAEMPEMNCPVPEPVAELSSPQDELPVDTEASAVLLDKDRELQPEELPDLTIRDVDSLPPLAQPVFAAGNEIEAEQASMPKDEIDADLLPVFLEEGRDMLPQMGLALRSWQDKPADAVQPQSLLRLLHTLKGSARMAGAMRLGQHLHDMETRIENLMHLPMPSTLAIDDLLIRYDQALQLFDRLQDPQASQVEEVKGAGMPDSAPTADTSSFSPGSVVLSPLMPLTHGSGIPVRAPVMTAPMPSQMVRVRADILDRLVNQAGEVSISRSRLENEVGTLQQSLSELTENLVRLRDQLREIEMQAETQITSRMAHSADREFDPLEFDRFTRLQELTRMMAESVNDVGSVHQNLSRTLDNATGDLSMQARLMRELQQDLMRVRMVQFSSISERLFRVTRQAAKEVDKRVNLDIRGSAVEIDRGVLEKMTGPFEHLLRNAVVHGIESRESRRAAGKNETGELRVEIRQEGNEVVIQFSDDGQGLNIGRIRDKATSLGLLSVDSNMSDESVTDLIFHAGFSTAHEVTELAGRGIGMDVVRSEAAALGGRVDVHSEPGKGAHFTIRLPLTLAVTQVVLFSAGGNTYAVPSVLVEQVQQLKTSALAAAYNEGAVVWQGLRVPMYYLPALLGDTATSPLSQHYSPLMILKSGHDRVAIHIDEVIGNREVVVKNVGPQLARMIGIAGATVLGSGDIVLILNPVPLAQRTAHESVRAPRLLPSDAPAAMGAVAEMIGQEPSVPAIGPVQGLRTQHIVMVVDDSLTVRRVTQRLLAREGYQVVLAKDGVDALEHLQSVTPDVMLVDIEMPRMDGFDLTRNVRNDERTRRIPIIMITSRTAEKHRNYALELGVNEYLGKPYQEEALLRLIAGYLNKEEQALRPFPGMA